MVPGRFVGDGQIPGNINAPYSEIDRIRGIHWIHNQLQEERPLARVPGYVLGSALGHSVNVRDPHSGEVKRLPGLLASAHQVVPLWLLCMQLRSSLLEVR